ncbi:MAG: hypothetical protein E7031_06030 [Akkermansiaceae bacterium]|nr:hypothetical protein [Akkermansiaceae bacterium]
MNCYSFLLAFTLVFICGAVNVHGETVSECASSTSSPSYEILAAFSPAEQMCFAIVRDDVTAIEQLLAAGVSPNANIGNGCGVFKECNTPVRLALVYGSDAVVAALFEKQCILTSSDVYLVAKETQNTERVIQMLRHGCNVHEFREDAPYPLIQGQGLLDALRILDMEFKSGIEYAEERGKTEQVELLKQKRDSILTIVQLMIENGVSVHQKDSYGWTALHHAAFRGTAEMVALLCELGADVNARTNFGHTPLMLASERNVSVLQQYGAENRSAAPTDTAFTQLVELCENEAYDEHSARKLLTDNPDVVNSIDSKGRCLLLHATFRRNISMVKLLLEHGANPSLAVPDYGLRSPLGYQPGETLLHAAAQNSDVGLMKLLVTAGADLSSQDVHGNMPCVYAENMETLRLLTDNGRIFSFITSDHIQKMIAVFPEEAVIEWVLAQGVNLNNSANPNGGILGYYSNNPEITRMLLHYGANPNTPYEGGKTSLISLISREFGEAEANVAEEYLRAGANIHMQDADGNTALHHAVRIINKGRLSEWVDFLLQQGANPSICNNKGQDVMSYAFECAHNYAFGLQIMFQMRLIDSECLDKEIARIKELLGNLEGQICGAR